MIEGGGKTHQERVETHLRLQDERHGHAAVALGVGPGGVVQFEPLEEEHQDLRVAHHLARLEEAHAVSSRGAAQKATIFLTAVGTHAGRLQFLPTRLAVHQVVSAESRLLEDFVEFFLLFNAKCTEYVTFWNKWVVNKVQDLIQLSGVVPH